MKDWDAVLNAKDKDNDDSQGGETSSNQGVTSAAEPPNPPPVQKPAVAATSREQPSVVATQQTPQPATKTEPPSGALLSPQDLTPPQKPMSSPKSYPNTPTGKLPVTSQPVTSHNLVMTLTPQFSTASSQGATLQPHSVTSRYPMQPIVPTPHAGYVRLEARSTPAPPQYDQPRTSNQPKPNQLPTNSRYQTNPQYPQFPQQAAQQPTPAYNRQQSRGSQQQTPTPTQPRYGTQTQPSARYAQAQRGYNQANPLSPDPLRPQTQTPQRGFSTQQNPQYQQTSLMYKQQTPPAMYMNSYGQERPMSDRALLGDRMMTERGPMMDLYRASLPPNMGLPQHNLGPRAGLDLGPRGLADFGPRGPGLPDMRPVYYSVDLAAAGPQQRYINDLNAGPRFYNMQLMQDKRK